LPFFGEIGPLAGQTRTNAARDATHRPRFFFFAQNGAFFSKIPAPALSKSNPE
jgi:hypothetical protein